MSSFCGLGIGLVIGLSIIFGILLLAFVGEVCYLVWWKKNKTRDIENQKFSSSNNTLTHLSCFKTPNASRNTKPQENTLQFSMNESHEVIEKEQQIKDLPIKDLDEESLDIEIIRLHNLCGPPRFLFTINEETKEDMEVDSIKGSRTMSLSDVSSPIRASQLLHMEGYLNPLYDFEANEFDFNKFRSSPPPTFKFMRDAEEKLLKRLMALEAQKRANMSIKQEEKEGGLVNLDGIKGKSEIEILHHNHQISTPSQVLPLASSPIE